MPLSLFQTDAPRAAPNTRVRTPRVCFALPFAQQLLIGGTGSFGGAELRGAIFLKGIARDTTLDVHAVVIGTGTPPSVRTNGIAMHYRPNVPFAEGHQDDGTRSVWADVDADVYVAFGANEATAELARFCLARGRALIVSLASDISFDAFVYENSVEPDPYGMAGHYIWYGMRHATEVVVQTERQQQLLAARVGRTSTLIRNPAPSHTRTVARSAPRYGGRLLWIGRDDPNKRYDEALMLAAALPHRPLIMVCNGIQAVGAALIADLQQRLPNLALADHVALADVDALFRSSDLLINTSVVEGFPNTFLQAGMHGIPIVSMAVDPDGVLGTHGCGKVANGTREDFAHCVEALLTDTTAYAAAAEANVRWVREHHDADTCTAQLQSVVRRVLAGRCAQ